MPNRAAALSLMAFVWVATAPVQADVADLPGGPPPKRSGTFAVGPEVGLVIPLSTNRLCPAGSECIIDLGMAVAVGFSYRWKGGFGLGFAYEFWLMTANGVYETSVAQSFLLALQYSFLPDRATHPIVRARGGPMLLGPSFRVETVGGMAEIGAGAEVELDSDIAFSFFVTGNLLRTGSFVTPADGVLRASTAALDAMLVLRIGLNFYL